MIISTNVRRAALIASLLALPGVHAAEVAGIRLDDSVRVGGNELALNGAGVRSKLFIKVYVGALYVSQKSASPAAIIDSPAPRRMLMRLQRDLGADALSEALEEGLTNNHSPAELATIKPQSEQLSAIMRGIGKVKEGDTVTIDFATDGITISLNGSARGKVAGADISRALLKVWLGEKPVDAALKKALLGS